MFLIKKKKIRITGNMLKQMANLETRTHSRNL